MVDAEVNCLVVISISNNFCFIKQLTKCVEYDKLLYYLKSCLHCQSVSEVNFTHWLMLTRVCEVDGSMPPVHK